MARKLDRGIVEVGPGRYRATYQVDGRRQWKRGDLDTCRKWLHECRYGQAQAKAQVGKLPTLAEWLKTWMAELGAGAVRGGTTRRAPGTIVNYKRRCELLADLGNCRLTELRPEHVSSLYRALSAGTAKDSKGQLIPPLKPSYVREVAAALRSSLQAAVDRGLLTTNPAKSVPPPGSDSGESAGRSLSDVEVSRLLHAASGDPDGAIVTLLVTCGLRRGEAIALKWENVHLDATPWISVEHSAGPVTGQGMVLRTTKTRRGRRQIAISTTAAEALHKAKAQAGNSEFVFPSPKLEHRPLSAQHVRTIWNRVCKTAGVEGATPHSARHTIASRHITESPAAVAAYLGHDPVVLLRTYTHPTLQATQFIADAADRLAALGQDGAERAVEAP